MKIISPIMALLLSSSVLASSGHISGAMKSMRNIERHFTFESDQDKKSLNKFAPAMLQAIDLAIEQEKMDLAEDLILIELDRTQKQEPKAKTK